MLKAVVDTNVFISGLLKGRTSRAIIEALSNNTFQLIISKDLMNELIFSVRKPKLLRIIPESESSRLVAIIKRAAVIVNPPRTVDVCRDPKDNKIIEAAIAAKKCDLIVSGDKDLLVLSAFEGIPILTPRKFLEEIR